MVLMVTFWRLVSAAKHVAHATVFSHSRQMPEWSKEADSMYASASCVGSNLTALISAQHPATCAFHMLLLDCPNVPTLDNMIGNTARRRKHTCGWQLGMV